MPTFCLVECNGTMILREKMIELIEPAVQAMGYELSDLEFNPGWRQGQLRLFIDNEQGVTLEDCERVSKQIGALLDVEDPIPGRYVLEVSSPGMNRTLRTREHYERFSGQRVKVQLKAPLDGQRKFTGILQGLEDEQVVLRIDSEVVRLPLADVQRSRLVPEW